jgi:predicted  nucleic acid-binding Zn-ribbon protein
MEQKYSLDTKVSELSAKLGTSTGELSAAREELDKLRKANSKMDSAAHEMEKSHNQNMIRLSSLEQQVCNQPTNTNSRSIVSRMYMPAGFKHRSDSFCNNKFRFALPKFTIVMLLLFSQVKDKDELLVNLRERLEAAESHKHSLEESLSETRTSAARSEERVAAVSAEIRKGNAIIEKLQTDNKSAKGKAKLKAAVITQQESLLGEKQV